MSNALAIASVTAMLRARLESAFTDAATTFPTGVQGANAFVQRPGGAHAAATAGADITLYRTSPHPQWRNCDLPTRAGTGIPTEKPLLGLVLRYLVTTFGASLELEAEQLLGIIVTHLHTNATLTRAEILAVKGAPPQAFLADTDLDTQPELVKFTVLAMEDEDMSRVWSMMPDGTFAPAVLVEASVVFVQPEIRVTAPLPVLERALAVVPSRQPLIVRIEAESGGPTAPIVAGQPVVIRGLRLDAPKLRVEIDGVNVPAASVTALDDERIRFVVPANTLAGARGVRVLHDLLGTPPVLGPVSGVVPMIVRPRVTSTATVPGTIRVRVAPAIGTTQALEVLLSNGATTFALPGVRATTTRIDAPLAGVAAGTYVVRARVDGVESVPTSSIPGGPIDTPAQAV
jgi:hypothetical protein